MSRSSVPIESAIDDGQHSFRAGPLTRAFCWLNVLAWMAALVALWRAVARHPTKLPPSEIGSGIAISLLLVTLVLLGIGGLRTRLVIGPDAITIKHLLRTRRFPSAELGGYGRLNIVVGILPILFVRLYSPELKEIARMPLSGTDREKVIELLARRLPLVVDDGSAAFPKPRIVGGASPGRRE